MPLPDTAAALRELEYAYDVLRLDGVSMLTSYDERYLGDPAFEEFFQELDRRNAVVVLHPNVKPPGSADLKVVSPASLVEFVFDSTRCVANLLYSGTLERYPNIRYVVPHAGGTVPFVASRIRFGEIVSPKLRERVPKGAMNYLRSLYYDTAIATSEPVIAALRQFVPASQVVFGSDFPYIQGPVLDELVGNLNASELLDEGEQEAINRGNALRLFPRFAATNASATAGAK